MKKYAILLLAALSIGQIHAADTLRVERARFAGPFVVHKPIVLDSMTLDKKKYSPDNILDTQMSFEGVKKAAETTLADQSVEKGALHLAAFQFVTSSYGKVDVKIEGADKNKVYIGGNEGGSATLTPGQYDVVVKFVGDSIAPKISVISDKSDVLSFNKLGEKRAFNLDDNMEMKYYRSISLSPSGKYLVSQYSHFNNQGQTIWESKITEMATGRVLAKGMQSYTWMPNEDKYYNVVDQNGHKNLIVTDPATGKQETIARDLPTDGVTFAPNGEYLIYYIPNEGPQKQDGVFEVYTPDDRQPGYRSRYSLGKYNIQSGISEQITYGSKSTYLMDISDDSKYILFSVSSDSITARPSELTSAYRLNIETMVAEQLISKEGFMADAKFFPGSSERILVKGTPEAFGGIGRNLPADMTPSMYDYQLFEMNAVSKEVTPLTKDFDPSIENIYVSKVDGMVYFTAENKDCVTLHRLDPKTLAITQIATPLDLVNSVTIADNAPMMVFYGNSACTPDRMYRMPITGKKQTATLIEDLNAERMAEIQLGTCEGYSFKSSRGYDITGFYYLPANMDKSKKYPVIVDYYGGCSPTSRRFGGGSHYPAHYWNALGYVVLIVNPSGAAGFGQEWAARHVNTAGEGVAEDIIEATEWFADNNAFINKDKIGCVSASYGGFMTQTLLSKTDLYACGISHAGISSHTSYWGEGYWGHSYSEVSMANSYPWTRKDLYVDRSPIYNADKIHKPILFTHGTADTNVPIGESIQMYTAMKILGVPTAFVMVEGENHGIMDYSKRKKWINTMMAWFQRWLQDDDTWWNGMYPTVE